jgi:hypothetical protein
MYCLRARDGALAWRFRVAPESRQIVSYDQLESAWPVHGNVLVCDGPAGHRGPVAYASAGRSSYVDGGVYLCAVDATAGNLLFRRRISHRDPETDQEPQETIRGVIMPGAIPDVLSTDGTSIFMRHLRFDLEGNPLPEDTDHLYSSAGFLDDTWWHRTYLQYGREMRGGYGGWTAAGRKNVSGRALVLSGDRAFGFGRTDYTQTGSHLGLQGEYRLFGVKVNADAPQLETRKRQAKSRVETLWSRPVPFFPRAALLAGDMLFVAGPSSIADFEATAPAKAVLLQAIATEDGKTLVEHTLQAAPVYDSLAAAKGCLFFTTVDNRIECWDGAQRAERRSQ